MELLLSNDRKIASHRNRYSPPEHQENTLLLAYGDRKYEKMVLELADQDDELKLKILVEINEDFRNSNKIALASITSEITQRLVEHLTDPNNDIRELSSRALSQTCKNSKTREIVVSNGFLTDIKARIEDDVPNIRFNAYQAMLEVSKQEHCSQVLIDLRMVEVCVEKLAINDEDRILLLIHKLLRQLLLVDRGTKRFLEIEDGQGVNNLCLYLSNNHPDVE